MPRIGVPTNAYTIPHLGHGTWVMRVGWDMTMIGSKGTKAQTHIWLEMNPWVIKQITRKHVHVATQNIKIRTATPQDPCQIFPIVTDFTCTLAQCLEQQLSLAAPRDWTSSPWWQLVQLLAEHPNQKLLWFEVTLGATDSLSKLLRMLVCFKSSQIPVLL